MPNWKNCLVSRTATLADAISVIDGNREKICLVVDQEDLLLGTVTDGDIRRSVLKGISLDSPVDQVMNTKPRVAHVGDDSRAMAAFLRAAVLQYLPIVNDAFQVVGLVSRDSFTDLAPERPNWVVLMAGGLGTRLRPLTDNTPKPLLTIGDRPLLETIIESFVGHGFRHFYISVNYMADQVKDRLGDGTRFGVEIRYLDETSPLGTAGPLSLLPTPPSAPLIVMNGDILTKVNFGQLLDFHEEQGVAATMCVREYDLQVPYGVVQIEKNRLQRIDEKPVHKFFVNAGIYVLGPGAVNMVPRGKRMDMTQLFDLIVANGNEASVFPLREFWIDIGRMEDFERANSQYHQVFS